MGIVCIFFAKVGSSGLEYKVARYCDYARVSNGAWIWRILCLWISQTNASVCTHVDRRELSI